MYRLFKLYQILAKSNSPRLSYSDLTENLGVAEASICVAMGCTGCTCTPRAEKKIGPNLQEKVVMHPLPTQRVHPRGKARVLFLGNC